jgi:hypothetical protein
MELAASQPERYSAIGLVATTTEPPSPAGRTARRERADAVERDSHWCVYGPDCLEAVRAWTR